MLEYIAFMNEGKTALSNVISFSKRDETTYFEVDVALQYTDGYNETILSFANNINNHDGGTQLVGLKTALTGVINRHADKAGWVKGTRPTGDDLREGLTAVVSVRLPEPSFNNQTKDKLLNPEIEPFRFVGRHRAVGAVSGGESEGSADDLRKGYFGGSTRRLYHGQLEHHRRGRHCQAGRIAAG